MRFALIVMLVACGGKEPSPPPAVGSGSGSAALTPVAPKPPGKDFVALLTAHAKPTLVGPFAPLTVSSDLTIGEARRIAPDLVVETNLLKALDWFEYTAEPYAGVSLRTERFGQIDSPPDAWLVGRLRAVFLHGKPDLEATLTKAWGTPKKIGRRALWFDPPAHLRCMLWNSDGRDTPSDSLVLDCGRYVPLAELIGTGKTLFGFEDATPLLGMTMRAVKARWGRRVFDDGVMILLPPTELAERATTIRTADFEAPATIGWYTLSLSADQATISALLETKFGKPKQDESIAGDIYRAKPRVVFTGSQITVGVVPEPE
jgi:hypothetical protein